MSAALPASHLRGLSYATLTNTVGSGLWTAGVALFLTRSAGLPAVSVGAGLTFAGVVGLAASVPLGHLADRRDPRSLRALLQVLQAAVAAAYLLVRSFPVFLLVAILDALLVAGNLSVRAALVAAVGGPEGRIRAFATLRAVANVGIAVGAFLAAFALAADTRLGYVLLVVGNSLTFLVSAALLMRLPAFPPAGTTGPDARLRALRDRPFLAVSAASAVLSVHHVVLVLIVPLWIVSRTGAPRWAVSVVLITNTVLTVLLAVWIGRGAETARPAGRAMRRAGAILAVAMLLYAATAGLPPVPTVGLLALATAVYTVGDLLHVTAAAGLSYDLATPGALGQYQGANVLLTGLAEAAAPAVLTILIVNGGTWRAWATLGAVFLGAGVAVPALVQRAIATRPVETDPAPPLRG
jgi:predicted MFS family arabinose efflux permease